MHIRSIKLQYGGLLNRAAVILQVVLFSTLVTAVHGLAHVQASPIIFTPKDAASQTFLQPTIIPSATTPLQSTLANIIPMPVDVHATDNIFTMLAGANIYVKPNTTEINNVGQYLADKLNPSTGYNIRVLGGTGTSTKGNIYLTVMADDSSLGTEGYYLTITQDAVSLSASTPAGLFRGIQTIRQLLPAAIETSTVQPGPWNIPTGAIRDYPRFTWRGYMLDVARHFFDVDEVKRALDLMAYYKMNYFHLHLSDDQGWRIAIQAWPNLTAYGGSTQTGGGAGGYYTQADYMDIVNYATSRYITIVPEIDMPGHTNAALSSYPALNCNGIAPSPRIVAISGSSSLCVSKDITYTFVDDVIKELAAITPGPYIHIGGDESTLTHTADYVSFINRVQKIIKGYNKRVIGWQDISQGTLVEDAAIQHWNWNNRAITLRGVQQGATVIMSPIALGQRYAGFTTVQTGYRWEPTTQIKGLAESNILGVEAPLWTEIIVSRADIDRMTYPWLLGYAEIGWSPANGRSWPEYKIRLGAHGPRLTALGVSFYRSLEVPWQ